MVLTRVESMQVQPSDVTLSDWIAGVHKTTMATSIADRLGRDVAPPKVFVMG